MNEMYEIYNNKNDLYDELVNHEDYNSNLYKFINNNFDFANKTVCELGIGSGRVTKTYINKISKVNLYDLSEHMLKKAKINLSAYKSKSSFEILNNKYIDQIVDTFDFLIEGWSFGHLISDEFDTDFWISKLINNSKRIAKTNIFIETMGAFVENPNPPSEKLSIFYSELKRNGYTEHIIRTDYKFETVDQAKYILGSFFGKAMENKIQEKNELIIKEYTGIWVYTN